MDAGPLFQELQDALNAEKQAVRTRLGALECQPAAVVSSGTQLCAEPGAYLYRFDTELEFLVPDGTRVRLEVPGLSGAGEVVDHDPGIGVLECQVREDLGAFVPQAQLTFESTLLLDLLAARLKTIEEESAAPRGEGRARLERAVAFLSGDAPRGAPVEVARPGLSDSQRRAISFLLGQRVGYLWGPPGTGKTRSVAHLVHELVSRGERVLLTAHTNVATDNALLRFLGEGQLEPGKVIRVGYRSEALRAFGVGLDDVVHDKLVGSRSPLVRQVRELCAEVAGGLPEAPYELVSNKVPVGRALRIAVDLAGRVEAPAPGFPGRLAELCDAIEAVEREVVGGAAVVASTLTGLYTNKLLRGLRTDALVLDEASIASLALCLVAAWSADKRALAVGDFMQLPAIVQAEQPVARKWLGRHVFASAGCDRPERDHPLRAMLDEQWRMHPRISAAVSSTFYAGKLRDGPGAPTGPADAPAVLLLDTGRLQPRTETSESGSKRNPVHARLIAELLRRARSPEIAVIAPYRAQVRALRDQVREADPKLLSSGKVEIFTVHRFQGRDKELVIFDTTESPGSRCRFLDEHHNPDAPNLVNVALSRARRRLILVADLRHLSSALGRQAMLARVLSRLRIDGCLELEAGLDEDAAALERFLGRSG